MEIVIEPAYRKTGSGSANKDATQNLSSRVRGAHLPK
jgi:hypothetical protein